MTPLEMILETWPDEEFLKADGYDTAILGVEPSSMRLVYSMRGILACLMEDMDYEEAIEFFDFNIGGACVGEKTPIYVDDMFFDEFPQS